MPFELEIHRVEEGTGEAWVYGAIVSGAFSGPEAVRFVDDEGRERHSFVTSHGLENPSSWPVVPGDGTTVRLTIPLEGSVRIDSRQKLRGLGVVTRSRAHVDIDAELDEPVFWALELALYLDPHLDLDDGEAALRLFGVPVERQNEYFRRTYADRWKHGVSPRIVAPIDADRYVELEVASGVECQWRYWLGSHQEERRVLAGYQSGHSSTPAFRLEEIYWLARQWQGTRYVHMPLLLMTVSYTAQIDAGLRAFTHAQAEAAPWVLPGRRAELESGLCRMMVVREVRWTRDDRLGWVNNWTYSQRNPKSAMSVLQPDDFAFIERFFADVPASRPGRHLRAVE